ncbi:MAG: MFS transporter [Gemmatimonadota bacterium]|nr:MFS transporter [Gemmatimonadota bacterium]
MAIDSRRGGIPALRKVGYGFGTIGFSLPHQAVATFLIFYATAILGIPASLAGIAVAISIAWDAALDPLMGWLSDRAESRRFGRRHQFLLIGGALVALLTYLLWSIDPSSSANAKLIRMFVLVLALKTSLTIYVVPYNALGGELTPDYNERSSIQGMRATFYLVGMVTAIVGGLALFFRSTPQFPKGQLNPAAYPPMGAAWAAITIVAALIVFAATRRYIPVLPKRSETMRHEGGPLASLRADIAGTFRNRDFFMLALMMFTIEAGFQFGITISIHTNTYTYGLTGPKIGLLALVLFACSIASQPFWVWFTKRYDKKPALILGGALALIGFIGAPWAHVWWHLFPIDSPKLPLTLGMFNVLAGIGNGAFMSVPYAMVADTADVAEVETGKREEALYFGMYTFAYKLGAAVSLVLSGLLLDRIGFIPSSTSQSDAVRFNLAMTPTYLILITIPFALWCLSRYRITRERFAEIRARLDKAA